MRVAVLAILLPGCALDLKPPLACDTHEHCNPGRRCFDHQCVDQEKLCVEPACALFALSPAVAEEGDTVELEGIFEPAARVAFPGGVVVTPSALTAHRAVVTVPAGAGAGELTVTSAGRTVGGLAFRRVGFAPALDASPRGEQESLPRGSPTLTQPRAHFGALSIGTSAYAFGGEDAAGTPLATVERATLNADGTLSGFVPFTASSLREARTGAAVTEAGRWVYVAGGLGAGGAALRSVERAALGSDGTLGPFEPAGELRYGRVDAAAAMVGNALVVLGGRGEQGAPTDSVERAPVDGKGQLGAFSDAPALSVARAGAAVVMARGALWVMGGSGRDGPLAGVERGAVDDARLTGFTVAEATVTARERAVALHLGHSVYLFGGEAGQVPLRTVERADLSGGQLGAFTGAGSLAAPRSAAALFRGDNGVHLVGGRGPSGALAGSESFSIDGGAAAGDFQSMGTIADARKLQGAAVLGRWLYLVGGRDGRDVSVAEVVRAPIAADGTVGPFTAAGSRLLRPRSLHRLAAIGPWLFVLGGSTGPGTVEPLIERAPVAPDGGLGAFEPETGATMIVTRAAPAVVVRGGFLYVLGGNRPPGLALKTIERAPLLPEGHLGPFEAAGELTVERFAPGQLVVGDALYLAGGGSGPLVHRSLERLRFAGDGTLRSIDALAVELVTPRAFPAGVFLGARWVVLGGDSEAPLASVESALPAEGGTFATFAIRAPGLTTPRSGGSALVLGDFAYVLGGHAASRVVDVLERASLE